MTSSPTPQSPSDIPDDIMQAAIKAHEEQIMADIEDEPLILARAILAERNRSKWQPIETAPKDGTAILVWAPGYEWPEVVLYDTYDEDAREEMGEDGFWRFADEALAEIWFDCGEDTWTHWMLPPAPPEGK